MLTRTRERHEDGQAGDRGEDQQRSGAHDPNGSAVVQRYRLGSWLPLLLRSAERSAVCCPFPGSRTASGTTSAAAGQRREEQPLPEGTYAIGTGLIIAGLSAYGFQILAARQLTDGEYAALNGCGRSCSSSHPASFSHSNKRSAGRSPTGEHSGSVAARS